MFPVETISAKMLDYYVDRRDTLIIDLRDREEYGKNSGVVLRPWRRKSASCPSAREKRPQDPVCDWRF